MDPEIVGAFASIFVALITGIFAYKGNVNLHATKSELARVKSELAQTIADQAAMTLKADVLGRILDISLLNEIRGAVGVMFEETSADRYLILVAVNGKTDFNVVTAIFEQHGDPKYKINAIATYRSLKIDAHYKQMLEFAEKRGQVEMIVAEMPDSLLKGIYVREGIKYSKVRHLLRVPIDDGNDVLVYCSIAKHRNAEPYTLYERTLFMTQHDAVVVPALRAMVDGMKKHGSE